MITSTDIDIDLLDRDKAQEGLCCIPAVELNTETGLLKRHGSGVYFQNIPVDPDTGMAVFEYKEAKDLGYFKIDLLSNTIYDGIESEAHLDRLLAREVIWSLFENKAVVDDLFHLANHFGIVQSIWPQSIEDLAVILALIRSAKKHLIGQPREIIDAEVWKPDGNRYYFKRAHAIAYATIIVMQLNLMCERMEAQLLSEADGEMDFL